MGPSRALAILQYALTGCGIVLLAAYGAARLHAHVGQAQALAAFDEVQRLQADAPVDQSLWSTRRIAAYQESLRSHQDAPVGVLSIDRFDLRVPIFPGTSELVLNRGLGHIDGTAPLETARGNVGIAGHRDGFFRPLEGIEVGDTIHLHTSNGASRYRVRETLIVEPEDVYVLNPTPERTLTLVTCYPFYFAGHAPQRFIVRATAESTPATSESTPATSVSTPATAESTPATAESGPATASN